MDVPPWMNQPFTTSMAQQRGYSRQRLQQLVSYGAVTRITRGVHVATGVDLDIIERARAIGLVIPAHHVVCDRTAAWIHGVDVYDAPDVTPHLRIESVALRGHSRTTRPECASGTRDLQPRDLVIIDGVTVTTPVRTVLDLLCRLRERPALAMYDAFLRRGLVTIDRVALESLRHRGRRGIRRARPLIPLGTPLAESQSESFTRAEIEMAGLPTPTAGVEIFDDGIMIYRLDMAYEWLKIAVEYDGEDFHGESRREHDETRRAWLRAHGWHVIVVRKHQLGDRRSREWIAELAAVLEERQRRHERYSRIARRSQRY